LDGGSARRKAATYTQNNTNTDIHALSGIQTHYPILERVKTVHALYRAATVIGNWESIFLLWGKNYYKYKKGLGNAHPAFCHPAIYT
jgi:hypothetical protein